MVSFKNNNDHKITKLLESCIKCKEGIQPQWKLMALKRVACILIK